MTISKVKATYKRMLRKSLIYNSVFPTPFQCTSFKYSFLLIFSVILYFCKITAFCVCSHMYIYGCLFIYSYTFLCWPVLWTKSSHTLLLIALCFCLTVYSKIIPYSFMEVLLILFACIVLFCIYMCRRFLNIFFAWHFVSHILLQTM